MQITVVDIDGKGNPAADGCSAEYSVMEHFVWPPEYASIIQGSYDYYRLLATEAGGWKFVEFKWTFDASGYYAKHYDGTASGENVPGSEHTYQHPVADRTDSNLYEGHDEVPGSGSTDYTVSNCRAMFRRTQSTIRVLATCVYGSNPRFIGGGTVNPESDSKTANSGETSTFAFVATPDAGFRFVRWENDNGVGLGTNTTLTLDKVHTSEDQSFQIYAVFAKSTGLILRNSSGTILRGASGKILRDE